MRSDDISALTQTIIEPYGAFLHALRGTHSEVVTSRTPLKKSGLVELHRRFAGYSKTTAESMKSNADHVMSYLESQIVKEIGDSKHTDLSEFTDLIKDFIDRRLAMDVSQTLHYIRQDRAEKLTAPGAIKRVAIGSLLRGTHYGDSLGRRWRSDIYMRSSVRHIVLTGHNEGLMWSANDLFGDVVFKARYDGGNSKPDFLFSIDEMSGSHRDYWSIKPIYFHPNSRYVAERALS